MFEKRLREQLREDLEGPALVAPHPTQARYRLRKSAARRSGAVWLRAGSAIAAGAVVAGVLLSAGTGSTNPRIWTMRVASALTQMTEQTPAPPVPNEQTPLASPSDHDGSTGGGSQGGAPTVHTDDGDRGGVPVQASDDPKDGASPSPAPDEGKPSPAPSQTPAERGSSGEGGPAPTPSAGPEH
jgi:hypothetical protein